MLRAREIAGQIFGVQDPRYAIATANLGNRLPAIRPTSPNPRH